MSKMVRTCSIWRALEIVGDSSTMLIIEAALLGSRAFGQYQSATGLRRALLSDRLKKIVSAGVMYKVKYSERPARYEYRLSEMGIELYWLSLMMLRWERAWGKADQVVKVRLTHGACGQEFDPIPMCSTCGHEYSAYQVSWQEGPGLGQMSSNYVRRRQHRSAISSRPAGSAIMVDVAQIIGDRWAVLVLRALFTGLNTFDKIREDSGIATNILSERLNWMQVMELVTHRENGQKAGYRLTRKSVDLFPVLLMLMRWGDKYFAAEEGPPMYLSHEPDGHHLDAIVGCSACGKQVDVSDVYYDVDWPEHVSVAHRA